MAACYQLIVATLFIIMASTTLSAGQTPPSPRLGDGPLVIVSGLLNCSRDANVSSPRNTSGAPSVGGIPVYLTCNNGTLTLGQSVTDFTGTYTIIFKVLDGLLFDPSKCEVAIAAPLVACTIYPRQGIIRAPITFIALLQGLLPILIFTVGDYVAG